MSAQLIAGVVSAVGLWWLWRRGSGDKSPPVLDLHGYTIDKAKDKLKLFLKDCKDRGHTSAYVITGRGRHSQGKNPVIRPMVQEFLYRNGYDSTFEPDNPGKMLIYL